MAQKVMLVPHDREVAVSTTGHSSWFLQCCSPRGAGLKELQQQLPPSGLLGDTTNRGLLHNSCGVGVTKKTKMSGGGDDYRDRSIQVNIYISGAWGIRDRRARRRRKRYPDVGLGRSIHAIGVVSGLGSGQKSPLHYNFGNIYQDICILVLESKVKYIKLLSALLL